MCKNLIPLIAITGVAVAISAASLPAWMTWAGGGIGAGWWICRYAWWLNWSKHRQAARKAAKL